MLIAWNWDGGTKSICSERRSRCPFCCTASSHSAGPCPLQHTTPMYLHTLMADGYGHLLLFYEICWWGNDAMYCTQCFRVSTGENIAYFPWRAGFLCCTCLIGSSGFVKDYCQYCPFMNQNLFSSCKQLEAEHLGQESAENFATSRYCLCRGFVDPGWNTGQLWKAKLRNKPPSAEQGQQSWHKRRYGIGSSRAIPLPETRVGRQRGQIAACTLYGICQCTTGEKKWGRNRKSLSLSMAHSYRFNPSPVSPFPSGILGSCSLNGRVTNWPWSGGDISPGTPSHFCPDGWRALRSAVFSPGCAATCFSPVFKNVPQSNFKLFCWNGCAFN